MTNEKSVDEGNGEFHEDVGGAHGTPKRISIPPKLRKNVVWDERVATLRAAVRRKAAEIAEKSLLLDVGEPADATDDESYIRRTNSLLAATNFSARQRCPVDLEKAIKKDGALNPHAELVVFGEWLLVPNAPGLNRRGRRQFVQRLILRTLAVALAELRRRRRRAVAAGPGAETPKKPITATDLAKRWAMLFSDPVEPTDFDARLPTLRRLLPAFLGHLRSGACQHAVKTIRRAPEIEAVYRAITLSSRKVTTSPPPPAQSSLAPTAGDTRPATPPAQTPQPATLTPLHLELIYSAPAQEQEYRGRPPGSLPPSTINYLPTPVAASSPARSVRRDRQGKIALVPQLPIREHFKVRALIDRLVILVSITALSTGSTLKALLKAEANTTCFAQDRTTVWSKERDWRKQLPKLCLSKKTGQHFAIMIQDPTSEKLAKVPKVIDDRFGIDGPVALFLIELSVDLYPEPHHAPDEQILLREQMVGLLQRHHWGSTELLQGRRPQQPRHADARQVYDKPNGDAEKRDPRYLFPDRVSQQFADIEFDQPEVIARLLRSKSGSAPFLNATVYKGCDETGRKISVQHKVADQRNPARGTSHPLPDAERRARIELLLVGQDILQAHGLREVETLGTVSFRDLRRKLLLFRLPLVEPTQHRLDEAIAHMERRGIYGIELATRARAHRERAAARAAGQTLSRKKVGEGADLKDWDGLLRRRGRSGRHRRVRGGVFSVGIEHRSLLLTLFGHRHAAGTARPDRSVTRRELSG